MSTESPKRSRSILAVIGLVVLLALVVAGGLHFRWVRGLQAELAGAQEALATEQSARSESGREVERLQASLDRIGALSSEMITSLAQIQQLAGSPLAHVALEGPASGSDEPSEEDSWTDEAEEAAPPVAAAPTPRVEAVPAEVGAAAETAPEAGWNLPSAFDEDPLQLERDPIELEGDPLGLRDEPFPPDVFDVGRDQAQPAR